MTKETPRPDGDADIAIAVRNVSKMYPLYTKSSDRLMQSLWYALPAFLQRKPRAFYREFWALHNVSFTVRKGESVGIIGRNGSGKSTILQIVAGTLAPSHGQVRVSGRVAALLELGSGFNPDFTGRENVYLNGSIWGLSQAEIDTLYNEVVDFADIGQFIDQPVRLYSSGMVVRLAFAVQAFVPKEILIVDEALAVGDAAFQRKCMTKLEKFRHDGGTVLLVSHDAQTIVRQCQRCLLLSNGELLADGRSKPVTDLYQKLMFSDAQKAAEIIASLHQSGLESALAHGLSEAEVRQVTPARVGRPQLADRPQPTPGQPAPGDEPADWFDPNMPETSPIIYGHADAEVINYGMYNQQGEQVNVLVAGRRYNWTYRVRFKRDAYRVHFGMMLKTVDGVDVAGISSDREGVLFDFIPALSVVDVSFSIKLNLAPGTYFLNVGVYGSVNGQDDTYLDRRVDICMIRVLASDTRDTYGLAYLEPRFRHVFVSGGSPTTNDERQTTNGKQWTRGRK